MSFASDGDPSGKPLFGRVNLAVHDRNEVINSAVIGDRDGQMVSLNRKTSKNGIVIGTSAAVVTGDKKGQLEKAGGTVQGGQLTSVVDPGVNMDVDGGAGFEGKKSEL